MASQVTYTNLFSESRNNVVALITTTNIPDADVSSVQYRKRIYSRRPDIKSVDFAGYPIIIVYPSIVDPEQEESSLDGKSKKVNWIIEVEIITSDRGYGSKAGQGLSDMDTLSNYFAKTFMDITNRNTLSANSMYFSNFEVTSVEPEIINNELCYVRKIMLSFKSRIKVSI